MTYERYKSGMFRVCIFLTFLFPALAQFGMSGRGTEVLGIDFDQWQNAVFSTPVFIWITYFFSLWIYKGFTDKK